MKKLFAIMLAAMLALSCFSLATAEEETVMTYADFAAAEVDTPVVVEAYVQFAAYNAAYGNVSVFLADPDGAYYVYRAACDDALAAELVPGTKVHVAGYKGEWAGEVEIVDATITVLGEDTEDTYEAEAVDITEELSSETLIEKINQLVVVYGAWVVAYNEAGDAFSYAWDGSGQAGANSDLYFNVEINGVQYGFTVESDEIHEGTDTYTAVTNLKVGDNVDLQGFLYWYNGAQLHVNAVAVN